MWDRIRVFGIYTNFYNSTIVKFHTIGTKYRERDVDRLSRLTCSYNAVLQHNDMSLKRNHPINTCVALAFHNSCNR